MNNNIFRIVCQTLFVGIVLTCNFSIYGCKKKTEIEILEERLKQLEEENKRKDAIRKKCNKSYCYNLTRKILEEQMDIIDSIKSKDVSVYVEDKESYKDYYSVTFSSGGTVYGDFKGIKGAYKFSYVTTITEEDLNKIEPHAILEIFDKDGYYVYSSNSDDLEKSNQAIKERRADAEERKKMDVIVSGITISYERSEEGNTYVYSSERKLTPEQITEAIKKMKNTSFIKLVKFYVESYHYADYVFATKCIIYVNERDKIYKIIDGSPIRI